MKPGAMLIGGEWVHAADGAVLSVINPASETEIGRVPAARSADVNRAVDQASAAWPAWADMSPLVRAGYVRKAAELMSRDKERLAGVIVGEQGKTLKEAYGEVDAAVFMLNYAAEWALRVEGDVLPSSKSKETILILKVPHGVVAGITPWNYPLAVPARKIGPALVAGNCIVLKPHELTPLSALELAELFQRAGLPAGVLNVVTGTGREAGAALVAHPAVQYVTMTGSVRAGKEIMAAAAANLTPVSLELGGKAPFIVLEDADVDYAVECAVSSRFANCGQVCISNERMYVQDRIYDTFLHKFVRRVSQLNVGDPMRPDTDIGPKVSRAELDKVAGMVETARREGARVLTGGAPLTAAPYDKGFWYPPTVLGEVHNGMEIMQREVFGPVIPIMKSGSFEETLRLANDSQYGLSAYLFTNNYPKVMEAIRQLSFGELYINRPGGEQFHAYHSGYRNSGIGGDDGKHGFEGYFRKKTVYLHYSSI